ncbi:WD40-repeat-containing domain protein [Phyllosticta citribraziliensis]|uniref:WD40-repeat-containing domain protein n=1 Tax=Phyllosticta citribraziliensis TaxID=989973 RepID=A0ABR1M938_9PEZI
MSRFLQHGCARVPVTALAFCGKFVLSAEGPFLRVFQREKRAQILSERLFKSQAVHGILEVHSSEQERSSIILVYGGLFVRLVKIFVDRPDELSKGPVFKVADWILDVASCPVPFDSTAGEKLDASADCSTVAVTAHNALLRFSWSINDPSLTLSSEELTCASRCMLYSAHCLWLSHSKVLVASGTAFGEILVWSCDFSSAAQAESSIHHFFTGHEGSIFGVRISSAFTTGDGNGSTCRLLASCSDDRTIRLWNITPLPKSTVMPASQDVLGLVQDRETGFGANISDQSKSLAVAWGHTSRVWAVRFVERTQFRINQLMSFGEDATTRVWQLDYEVDSSQALTVDIKLSDTSSFHSGKNIWSMATNYHHDGDKIEIVTGAADSAITSHLWPFEKLESVAEHSKADVQRSFAFLSPGSVISTANSGQVWKADVARKDGDVLWHSLGQLDELQGYSIAAGVPELGLAFIASKNGQVFCVGESSTHLSSLTQVERKISGIYASSVCTPDGKTLVSLFVTQVGETVAEHFLFSRDAELKIVRKVALRLPSPFVPTSATYAISDGCSVAFVGSRSGGLVIFPEVPFHDTSEIYEYQFSARHKLHTPEAIARLLWAPSTVLDSSKSLGLLISVGRDGRCTATDISQSLTTTLVHQSSLPLGPNAEGCYIDPQSKDLMVYGFRSKHFVLYNVTLEQEVLSVECGGAHRIWSFCPLPPGGGVGGTFVWNHANTFKLYHTAQASHDILRTGGHGREIKALAACPTRPGLLATGAEDTTIRLFQYGEVVWEHKHADFTSVKTIRKHVTGIQHLAWSADGRFLFSSGGGEEFFVWRVQNVPVIGLGVVCEAVCPTESENFDLRIMNFEVEQIGPTDPRDHGLDEDRDGEFIITMVFSDSTLRRYTYTSKLSTKTFRLIHVGTYATSCLTQVIHVDYRHFLTAGTDGHITFWPNIQTTSSSHKKAAVDNLRTELSFATRKMVHQSTVKALSHQRITADAALLLTGGDDNAVALSLIKTRHNHETKTSSTSVSTLIMPTAHAATVTASALLRCSEDENRFLAVTSGNDQRVKVWEITVDLEKEGVEGVDVSCVADEPTAVADVSDMAVLGCKEEDERRRTVVLVGVGMDAWTLDLGLHGE